MQLLLSLKMGTIQFLCILEADKLRLAMQDIYSQRKKDKEKHKAENYWKYSTYGTVSKYPASVYVINSQKFCV